MSPSNRTAAAAEEPESITPTTPSDPFAFIFSEKVLLIEGRPFKFRELSVKENDSCLDASKQPDGTFNGRTNMRLMIAKSSVAPKISVDDLANLPNRIYLQIAEFVNEINSIDDALGPKEEEDEDEGKT